MDVRSDIFPDTPDGFHPRDVSVRLARPDERIRWDRLMNQHHYLGFKRFPGRGLPYVFEWRGQCVGLAGWQSGAFKCVNLLSKVTPFCRSIMTPCGTEGQLERSRSRTSPQDEPSQSFLCRSSLVAFPSLPDEKEFLQSEGRVILRRNFPS